jgi:WD40 repeat protein
MLANIGWVISVLVIIAQPGPQPISVGPPQALRTPIPKVDLPSIDLARGWRHTNNAAFNISRDGLIVAGGTGVGQTNNKPVGGYVVLWNAQNGNWIQDLGNHGTAVDGVRFSSDGKTLASLSRADSTIKLWNLPTGTLRRTIVLRGEKFVYYMGEPLLYLNGDGGLVIAGVGQPVGPELGAPMINNRLRAWDTQTGREKWVTKISKFLKDAISPDGKSVLVYSAKDNPNWGPNSKEDEYLLDKELLVIDSATGRISKTISLKTMAPNSVMFLSGASQVAAADDERIVAWDLKTSNVCLDAGWQRKGSYTSKVTASDDGTKVVRDWFVPDSSEHLDRHLDFFNVEANKITGRQVTRPPFVGYCLSGDFRQMLGTNEWLLFDLTSVHQRMERSDQVGRAKLRD